MTFGLALLTAVAFAAQDRENKVQRPQLISGFELSLTGEMRERLLTQGMVLNKRIALRGDLHRLHVVLSDPPSGAVGSVIIPADMVRAAAAR